MIINLPDNLLARLQNESTVLGKSPDERVIEILDKSVAPQDSLDMENLQQGLNKIRDLLSRIPCVQSIGMSEIDEPYWWLKFKIDINSKIVWIVVQELGHILNYLSVDEKLPTTFHPVSPPPYMNGGPDEFLSWVVEPTIPFVDTNIIFDYLDGRLPEGYEKEENWLLAD